MRAKRAAPTYKLEPRVGIEPTTYALRMRRSTPELSRQKGDLLKNVDIVAASDDFSNESPYEFLLPPARFTFLVAKKRNKANDESAKNKQCENCINISLGESKIKHKHQ